jgi:hypothetical protein
VVIFSNTVNVRHTNHELPFRSGSSGRSSSGLIVGAHASQPPHCPKGCSRRLIIGGRYFSKRAGRRLGYYLIIPAEFTEYHAEPDLRLVVKPARLRLAMDAPRSWPSTRPRIAFVRRPQGVGARNPLTFRMDDQGQGESI